MRTPDAERERLVEERAAQRAGMTARGFAEANPYLRNHHHAPAQAEVDEIAGWQGVKLGETTRAAACLIKLALPS